MISAKLASTAFFLSLTVMASSSWGSESSKPTFASLVSEFQSQHDDLDLNTTEEVKNLQGKLGCQVYYRNFDGQKPMELMGEIQGLSMNKFSLTINYIFGTLVFTPNIRSSFQTTGPSYYLPKDHLRVEPIVTVKGHYLEDSKRLRIEVLSTNVVTSQNGVEIKDDYIALCEFYRR